MSSGKEKCEFLRRIRKGVAERYSLDYTPSECSFQGDCSGTCPKCDAELKELQHQLKCKHSNKCTFYTLRFGCSFAAANTIKPQLL